MPKPDPAADNYAIVRQLAHDYRSDPYRVELARAVAAVVARDGTFDTKRVRLERAPWFTGPRVGSLTDALVAAKLAEPTGRVTTNGDTGNRNGSKLVHVYRLTRAGHVYCAELAKFAAGQETLA